MEEKFDRWRKSIKRSFGRKVGRDVAPEVQNLEDSQRMQAEPQSQQAQQAQQPEEKQKQLQQAEDLLSSPKNRGTWKTLKRSLGRKLGLCVRDELQKDEGLGEQQQRGQGAEVLLVGSRPVPVMTMQEAIDAGMSFDEALRVTIPAVPADLPATTPTTLPPARYRVRRTRLASVASESAQSRPPVRKNTFAVQTTAKISDVPFHGLNVPNLGTTPTTPGYPHPMEVVARVPEGERKFTTWSARAKPFWCCDQHDQNVGEVESPSLSSVAQVEGPYLQQREALQRFEDLQPTSTQAKSETARSDDAFSWPSSSNPGLLEPTMFKPVESLPPRRRRCHRPQEDEGEIHIGYAESSEDLQPAQSVAEALYGVNAPAPTKERKEKSVKDLRAGPINPEVNLRQTQASIAFSLQQAVLSNVEEGEVEAIEEKEENCWLEDSGEEAAFKRQALLNVVHSQRAAGSALLALAQSTESLQVATSQGSSSVPEPSDWLSSRYDMFPGESPAESSTASTPVYHLRDREKPKARVEEIRNWLAEWGRMKANSTTNGSPAVGKDTRSASSLMPGRPPPVASSSCTPRIRMRSREQIAHARAPNHRNSVVINGWTYSARLQEEDQIVSEPYGDDNGIAAVEEGAKDL